MSHSITFYALNSQRFAAELRESRQALLDRIEQRIRSATPASEYE